MVDPAQDLLHALTQIGDQTLPLASRNRFLPEACRWLDQLDFLCAEDYCVLVHRS